MSSTNTAPMPNSVLCSTPGVSNMLMAMLSLMMKNTSNLMKMVIPPSQTMPGKILMNAAYPLDGKEYAVHPQKKFFRRLFFTVITMNRISPNMTPSRMHPWLNSQRNCRRSANSFSRTKRFTSSLRLISLTERILKKEDVFIKDNEDGTKNTDLLHAVNAMLSYIGSDQVGFNDGLNYVEESADIDQIKETFKCIFIALDQKQHYDMMMEAVK